MNSYLLDNQEAACLAKLEVVFYLSAEWDEFWSFVARKSNHRYYFKHGKFAEVVAASLTLLIHYQNFKRFSHGQVMG